MTKCRVGTDIIAMLAGKSEESFAKGGEGSLQGGKLRG